MTETSLGDITLRADGASIIMRLRRVNTVARRVEFDLHMEFAEGLGVTVAPKLDCRLDHREVGELADYLAQHVGSVEAHDIEDSPVFVTSDFDFQFQALCGETAGGTDGDFTIRWLVNCGTWGPVRRPVYVAFQGCLDVGEALRWCDELRSLQRRLVDGGA